MGKSAKCIKMLMLLHGHGIVQREELATALDTNIRNLVEYRKELEEAGYQIESITGRYGGYRLDSNCSLPVLKLTSHEQEALLHGEKYLQVQSDFLSMQEFHTAMDKIRMQMQKTEVDNIYLQEYEQIFYEDIRQWILLCEKAIQSQQVMEIFYKGMKDKEPKTITIHPYEILHYQSAYYCLAYSLSAKDFRNFKFSRERMKGLRCIGSHFTRDFDFDVKAHVGMLGLMKDDLHEFEILVTGSQALLVAEKNLGLHPQMKWMDETTIYMKTIMEGKMNVHSFLLSLGSQVTILSPVYLQEEIKHIILEMYEKNFLL